MQQETLDTPPNATSLLAAAFDQASYIAGVTNDSVPNNYRQAMLSDKPLQWQTAVDKEIKSLTQNEVFIPCSLPPGRKAVGSRWVFTEKVLADGSIMEKARLVAQGFTQIAC